MYGGLIIEAWVGMRKFSGELFDASPTIRAMCVTTAQYHFTAALQCPLVLSASKIYRCSH